MSSHPTCAYSSKAYLETGADPNELLENQRSEYIAAVTEYLNTHKNKQAVWNVIKEDAGYKDTKLVDLPLNVIKKLYMQLTID